MPINDEIKCIVHGMETYFRTFALADNMCLHTGDIEWISPKPDSAGPSIVYKISLDERTVKTRLEELVPNLEAGLIPSLWVISPTSTPTNIVDYLVSIGFKGSLDPEHPEPGMALDIGKFSAESKPSLKIEIKKVKSLAEFALWIDVVNEALHGWKLLSIEHYSSWLRQNSLSFYLGYHNEISMATVATIQDGEIGSVEFVSTLKEYRRQGVATALCIESIKDLQLKGIKKVTLRSSTDAISVYTKLGFKPYYEQLLLSYPRG